MTWVMAILGACIGAMLGDADGSVLGFFLGAASGWQAVRIGQLQRRVREIEQRLGAAASPLSAEAPAARPAPANTAADTAVASTSVAGTVAVPPIVVAPPVSAPSIPMPASAPVPPERHAPATDGQTPPERAQHTALQDAPAPAATPTAPQEPSLADRLVAAVKRWFLTGNVPVKLGMLVLFFGVAAALKYVVDQGWIAFPIELRLAGIAAAAIGGLLWGWRNRNARPAFGLSLQGGAIGVLLLTVFAAFRLYGLLPAPIALGLVVVLVAGAAALAVLQNAVALAVLGFVGGYLAPVLISTGSGNHVALFTYYAVLNAAVFAIAWLRPWRALNLIGFAFTFGIGTLWGARYFRPELFASVEPFLVLFFLFYVVIAVLYALRGSAGKTLVDGTLVFGTPLLAFPLQAAMLDGDRYGLAWSALAVALLYAGLAWWLLRRRGIVLLGQAFAALALGFATLAVPLALSARWTCATWALEGVAVAWLGLRQRRVLPQIAGWALQGLAALAYIASFARDGFAAEYGERLLLNGHALSVLLLAGAALCLSWLYERAGARRLLVWPGFIVGMGWWCVAGVRELIEHVDIETSLGLVVFGAVTVLLSGALRQLLRWPRLGWNVVGVAVVGLALAPLSHVDADSALERPALLPWLFWFVALLFGLWRLRVPMQRGVSLAHVVTLATASLLYGLALHESTASIAELGEAWLFLAAIAPLMLLFALTWRAPRVGAFPLADLFPRYSLRWFLPAGAALGLAWMVSLGQSGDADPLPYIPLLNPIELFQLGLLLVAARWLLTHDRPDAPTAPLVAIAGFVFVSIAALRAVHQITGVDWAPSLLDDRIVQATLTVLWSVLGVVAWIVGSRRRRGGLWLCGAILMGIVLGKLLLVDRQYFGDASGILSFLAVGVLLVVVGRIAPTPPRREAAAAPDTETSA